MRARNGLGIKSFNSGYEISSTLSLVQEKFDKLFITYSAWRVPDCMPAQLQEKCQTKVDLHGIAHQLFMHLWDKQTVFFFANCHESARFVRIPREAKSPLPPSDPKSWRLPILAKCLPSRNQLRKLHDCHSPAPCQAGHFEMA